MKISLPITVVYWLSCVWLFVTLWTVAHQFPLSRQEYWSGLLFTSPGNLPDWTPEPHLLHWQVDSLLLSQQVNPSSPKEQFKPSQMKNSWVQKQLNWGQQKILLFSYQCPTETALNICKIIKAGRAHVVPMGASEIYKKSCSRTRLE